MVNLVFLYTFVPFLKFLVKVERAMQAGAVGVIIVNNDPDFPADPCTMACMDDTVGGVGLPVQLPVVSVSSLVGESIRAGDTCTCLLGPGDRELD